MELYHKIKHKGKQALKRLVYGNPAPRGVILMYHRIGEPAADPWELFVSETNFRQHLQALKKSYCVCLLSDLEYVMQQKKNGKRNLFITFDDGCLDNFDFAYPLLEKLDLKATFFVPAANLNGPSVFWWEALDYLFWGEHPLPEVIELDSGSDRLKKHLDDLLRVRDANVESRWSANREPAPSLRCQLYLDICDWIRPQAPGAQQKITEQLLRLSGGDMGGSGFFKKMTPEQIAFLTSRHFEIGGHTVHHPALKCHGYTLQQEEIRGGILQLEAATGKRVVSFAYPHGEYNADTVSLMKGHGIRQACTTDGGAVYTRTDRLTLPRILVRNTGAAFLEKQLNNLFEF